MYSYCSCTVVVCSYCSWYCSSI